MKERILAYIKEKGLSKSAFEKKAGLSNGYLSKFKGNFGTSKLEDILKAFPDLNRDWLITGEGSMLIESEPEEETHKVPLVPSQARGGALGLYAADSCYDYHIDEYVVTPIESAELAVMVSGESMAPTIPHGSIVYARRIIPDSFIPWGEIFVLDTVNGVIIKEVRKADIEGYITCYSLNTDTKYAPFDVPVTDIHAWFRVLGYTVKL